MIGIESCFGRMRSCEDTKTGVEMGALSCGVAASLAKKDKSGVEDGDTRDTADTFCEIDLISVIGKSMLSSSASKKPISSSIP
jgi:hypothetical protein